VVAGVLLAWALAAEISGLWAYFVAPLCSIVLYQLLLGAESLLLSAEDRVESVTQEMGDENAHDS
jgi:hypothetical protein